MSKRRLFSSIGVWAFLCLSPEISDACECNYSEISQETIRSAHTVSLVRVDSTKLASEAERTATGRLTTIEVYRGEATPTSRFNYSVHWCCGTKLQTGAYYLIVLNGSGDFTLDAGNTIYLGPRFMGSDRNVSLVGEIVSELISGKAVMHRFFRWGGGRVDID